MNDEPLPGMPAPAPRVQRQPKKAGARLVRYRPKTPRRCGDCTTLIHAVGVANAPYPKAARWRLTEDGADTYLCEHHMIQRTGP